MKSLLQDLALQKKVSSELSVISETILLLDQIPQRPMVLDCYPVDYVLIGERMLLIWASIFLLQH
jgi:hypothetical protein